MTIKKRTTSTALQHYAAIAKLLEDCYLEQVIDKKVQILYTINSLLSKTCRINIPSLITSDYIDTALYRIEESIRNIVSSRHVQSNNKDGIKPNLVLRYGDR